MYAIRSYYGSVARARADTVPAGFIPGACMMIRKDLWDRLAAEAPRIRDEGIPAVIVFGIPDEKDATGSASWRKDGIVISELATGVELGRSDLVAAGVAYLAGSGDTDPRVVATDP